MLLPLLIRSIRAIGAALVSSGSIVPGGKGTGNVSTQLSSSNSLYSAASGQAIDTEINASTASIVGRPSGSGAGKGVAVSDTSLVNIPSGVTSLTVRILSTESVYGVVTAKGVEVEIADSYSSVVAAPAGKGAVTGTATETNALSGSPSGNGVLTVKVGSAQWLMAGGVEKESGYSISSGTSSVSGGITGQGKIVSVFGVTTWVSAVGVAQGQDAMIAVLSSTSSFKGNPTNLTPLQGGTIPPTAVLQRLFRTGQSKVEFRQASDISFALAVDGASVWQEITLESDRWIERFDFASEGSVTNPVCVVSNECVYGMNSWMMGEVLNPVEAMGKGGISNEWFADGWIDNWSASESDDELMQILDLVGDE